MSTTGTSKMASQHGRHPGVTAAPLVLLALVLLATAGGVTATVAGPTARPAAVACLVLPTHGLLEAGTRADDASSSGSLVGTPETSDVFGSEVFRIRDAHLDLPPPRG
ncbi:MAG: hypothetical protein MK116_00355 [Phycisphaerales bacterium]|nr:hypothetical protein [Phycisphaerales bacterium]